MSSVSIKIEPVEEASIVNVSSDDDGDEPAAAPSRNNEAPRVRHPDRPGTPETNCSICLEELNSSSYSDACWHMFCFECLKRWSGIESSCPLCKKQFKVIYHTFNEDGSCERYEVPNIPERDFPPRLFLRPFDELSNSSRRNEERLMSNISIATLDPLNYHPYDAHLPSYISMPFSRNALEDHRQTIGNIVLAVNYRARVYNENVWADPLPDLSGRFRDCSPAFYRRNPAQMHRLQGFIARDIMVIRNIIREQQPGVTLTIPTNEFLATQVMRSVTIHGIRDIEMVNMLCEFLGEHTSHFCHELYNFANSPYDMVGYDRNVHYSSRSPSPPIGIITSLGVFEPVEPVPVSVPMVPLIHDNETIVLDSEDDGDDDIVQTGITQLRTNTDVIVVNSSSEGNDSDVEILEHSFRPIETFNSSLDQPSTSTGIRAPYGRPNSRYNLRRRTMFSPPSARRLHLSRMTCLRRRIIIDSSSSEDEAPTPTVRTVNRIVCGKRKRMKKNKEKKRKRNNDDSRSEIHNSGRERSCSETSTSSSDIDSGPSSNFVSFHTNIGNLD